MCRGAINMPDLRAEVWARPGASTFERIYADAMTERLSGTLRAGGLGDGQFEFPDHDDAETLADLLLRVDATDLANAKRALIRVYSDGQSYPPVHEWRVDAVVPPDDDNDRWRVSGTDWLDWLNDAEVFPYDWDGTTPFTSNFPDHIWGGRNVLGDLVCRFQPERVVFTVNDATDAGTFTISVSTAGGSDTTAAIDYDATALAVYNALLATSEIDALEVDGDAGGPWTVTVNDPTVPIAFSTNNGNMAGTWTWTIDATGGTYDITVENPDTTTDTATLNWDDDAATVETALEALSTVTACTVTGAPSTGLTVTFETPDFSPSVTTDPTNLTGGASTADIAENDAFVTSTVQTQGQTLPVGWTSSEFSPTDILHGELQVLRCWNDSGFDPALPTGATTAGVFNGRAPYFPGVEKTARVQPGGIYQASVQVYARDTDTTIKLVLRDFADNQASAPGDTNYFVEQTVTADTWTTLTITDFVPADDVTEIKFRIAHSDPDESVDPPIVYWALPKLLEGQSPTTIGGVWESLFDDATSDHSGTRIVWEDEANPGSTWLTLDFDATNDSAGVAWNESDVEITAKRGWSYGRVFTETARLGYEGRIVPDPVTDGQWLFQLYNPAGMDADYSSDTFVGVRTGVDVVSRKTKRFRPPGTVQAVEGGERQWSISENAGAVSALGRMERYLPDRDLNGSTEIVSAASTALASGFTKSMSKSLRVVPGPDDPEPGVSYVPGDTIPVVDPPDTDTTMRVAAIGYTHDGRDNTIVYDVSMSSERLTGNAAIRAGVIQYLREQKEIREEPPIDPTSPTVTLGQSGGGNASGYGAYIHAARSTSQSIAVSGEPIAFDTIDLLGAAGFADSTPGTTITIPKAGYWNIAVMAGWSTHTAGGSVWITRERAGTTTTVWPPTADPGVWTSSLGALFEGTAHAIPCLIGDVLRVYVDADTASAETLASATVTAYLVDKSATVDQLIETLFVDSKDSTAVSTAATMETGVTYALVVSGNYRGVNGALGAGADAIQYLSPGEPQENGNIDADYKYASDSAGGTGHSSSAFLVDLGSGESHIEPDGGAATAAPPGHVYTYTVTGEGSVLSARLFDSGPYTDNNGQLRIDVFRLGVS